MWCGLPIHQILAPRTLFLSYPKGHELPVLNEELGKYPIM